MINIDRMKVYERCQRAVHTLQCMGVVQCTAWVWCSAVHGCGAVQCMGVVQCRAGQGRSSAVMLTASFSIFDKEDSHETGMQQDDFECLRVLLM